MLLPLVDIVFCFPLRGLFINGTFGAKSGCIYGLLGSSLTQLLFNSDGFLNRTNLDVYRAVVPGRHYVRAKEMGLHSILYFSFVLSSVQINRGFLWRMNEMQRVELGNV